MIADPLLFLVISLLNLISIYHIEKEGIEVQIS